MGLIYIYLKIKDLLIIRACLKIEDLPIIMYDSLHSTIERRAM